MTVIEIARLFRHVREAGANGGLRVNAIQKWSGGSDGDSWCCQFATMVLDLYYGGESPIPRCGACDIALKHARDKGLVVDKPEAGCLYFRLNSPTDAHHIGFVVEVKDGGFVQLSGNTSKDGLSSNGDGVYERFVPMPPRDKIAFAHLPPSTPNSNA